MIRSPLYAVVDVDACARADRSPEAVAQAFVAGGARWLQLRAKELAGAAFLDLAQAVVKAAGPEVTVVVNDRADVAVLAGAAGVHVGQDDLRPREVRQLIGPAAVVGLSTHSVAQAEAALDDDVSYLAIGPVFETATKDTGYTPVGLEMVSRVASLTRARGVPLVAIGGITLERAPSVLAAGADAVCVIGDLLRGAPSDRVREYLDALEGRTA